MVVQHLHAGFNGFYEAWDFPLTWLYSIADLIISQRPKEDNGI